MDEGWAEQLGGKEEINYTESKKYILKSTIINMLFIARQ